MSRVPAVQTLLLGRRQRDRLGFGLREPAGCNAHTANGRSKHSCQVPEAQTVLGEPMVKERLRLVTSSLALQETPKDRLCLSVPLCEGRPLAGGGRGSPWPRVLLSSSSHLQQREAERGNLPLRQLELASQPPRVSGSVRPMCVCVHELLASS